MTKYTSSRRYLMYLAHWHRKWCLLSGEHLSLFLFSVGFLSYLQTTKNAEHMRKTVCSCWALFLTVKSFFFNALIVHACRVTQPSLPNTICEKVRAVTCQLQTKVLDKMLNCYSGKVYSFSPCGLFAFVLRFLHVVIKMAKRWLM